MSNRAEAVVKIRDLILERHTSGPHAQRADGSTYRTLLSSEEDVRADVEIARVVEQVSDQERAAIVGEAYIAAKRELGA